MLDASNWDTLSSIGFASDASVSGQVLVETRHWERSRKPRYFTHSGCCPFDMIREGDTNPVNCFVGGVWRQSAIRGGGYRDEV